MGKNTGIHALYNGAVLRCFGGARPGASTPTKPASPKSKEGVIRRAEDIVCVGEWHRLIKKGTGAPGKTLELILGIDGGNGKTSDGKGIEAKYHSVEETTRLDLLHRDRPDMLKLIDLQTNTVISCARTTKTGKTTRTSRMKPMIDTYGYIGDNERPSLRHTVSTTSRLFITERHGCDILIRPKPGVAGNLGMLWDGQLLYQDNIAKLVDTLLVGGTRTATHVIYEQLTRGEALVDLNGFLDLMTAYVVVVDFDATLTKTLKGVRNHGTKIRIAFSDIQKLWRRVSDFDPKTKTWTTRP